MAVSTVYQLRITLKGTKPPIWRRVAVPADITLGRLHEVIQIVMGWTDSHLHQFILQDQSTKETRKELDREFRKAMRENTWDETLMSRRRGKHYFVPKRTPYGDPSELEGADEDAVTLAEVCPKVKSKLTYEYDFGDSWEHTIEVQKIVEAEEGVEYPVCLAGAGACPPEDCGGLWGYYDMLDALADPKHERHEELLEWLGGPFDSEAFDIDEINRMLG